MIIVTSPGPSFEANPFFPLMRDALISRGHTLVRPRMSAFGRADVIHLNFPEHAATEKRSFTTALVHSVAMVLMMAVHRLRGGRVIWTVHDVKPLRAQYPRLAAIYMATVRKLVDGYIFLSRSSRRVFEEHFAIPSDAKVLEAWHPFFPTASRDQAGRAKLRAELGLSDDDYVVGLLGDQKPYKNVTAVARLPLSLSDGRRVVPLIAGRADKMGAVDFAQLLDGRPFVRVNRRLDDEELEAYIAASDVVFLPYLHGWNSGMAMLVLSCGQRVLSSDLPIFEELSEDYGKDKVTALRLDGDDSAIAKAVNAQAISTLDTTQLAEHSRERSFDQLATNIERFMSSLKSR
jgi:beta-1,4-mannosyltransferase